MRKRVIVMLLGVLWAVLAGGCSTEAVRCSGHLTPINVPGQTMSHGDVGTRGKATGPESDPSESTSRTRPAGEADRGSPGRASGPTSAGGGG